jgi:thioredoxin reductase (NADPH)
LSRPPFLLFADKVRLAAKYGDYVLLEERSVADEFLGDGKRLSGLRLRDVANGAWREVTAAGAFVAIGHEPNTRLVAGQVALDAHGYVVTDHGRTNLPGVFAAGDCADPEYKQAVVAAGAGAVAALEAERFLA